MANPKECTEAAEAIENWLSETFDGRIALDQEGADEVAALITNAIAPLRARTPTPRRVAMRSKTIKVGRRGKVLVQKSRAIDNHAFLELTDQEPLRTHASCWPNARRLREHGQAGIQIADEIDAAKGASHE